MLKHLADSIWNCILIWKLYHGKQFQWQDKLICVYKFDYEMSTIANEFTKSVIKIVSYLQKDSVL